jgi:tetrahydromethanopterin S-methyltransferase subunit F
MLRFEHHSEKILPHTQWLARVAKSIGLAVAVVMCSLMIGVLGYHTLGGLSWIDAILEASMILGGMGAVAPMTNDAVKLFASFYALFSGLVVVGTMGIILAPWMHRLMHHFHREKMPKEK